jgi:hypothetical protein
LTRKLSVFVRFRAASAHLMCKQSGRPEHTDSSAASSYQHVRASPGADLDNTSEFAGQGDGRPHRRRRRAARHDRIDLLTSAPCPFAMASAVRHVTSRSSPEVPIMWLPDASAPPTPPPLICFLRTEAFTAGLPNASRHCPPTAPP